MYNKEYSEEELIKGCLKNSRKHQELLYRKFFPSMMRMCQRYTSDMDRAMMIVNDGFLRVFQKLDQYGHKGSLEGWIRRLVFHSLSDHFRKESKYLKFMIFEEKDKSFTNHSLDQLYLEDLLQIVNEIPGKSREVFKLFAIEGYSHAEIAEKLGISDGTSKWHLSEARRMLKQLIKKQNSILRSHARS